MTYEEAVAYLDTFTNYERDRQPDRMRRLRLARMQRLCRRVGDPQRRFRAVLVTGTNGKGSICAMLYAMLRHSSLRVGLYTSPHLEQLRERIRVSSDGPTTEWREGHDWIRKEEFAAALEQLRPELETLRAESPEEAPTYFEVLTALAFVYFSRREVEIAVIEVGLGGRLDATNVVEQSVSVFGPIDVDHAEILGDDPAAIAGEKAGILKPHQVAITVPQPEPVLAVLQAACEAQGVPLAVVGRDLTVGVQHHGWEGLQLSITGLRGLYQSVELALAGRHQATNAAAAVGALEALSGIGVPASLVEQGLARVEWPGRMEAVSDVPLVVMDGAHNAQALTALAQTLSELCAGRRITLLVGMSADKSPEELGRHLGPLIVSATCTRSRHPRAMDPIQLAQRLGPWCPDVHVMSDPVDAYTYLLNVVAPEDVIVVAGSFFLVGELRSALRLSNALPRRQALAA
jgi:dihydrofolate synthase/folylpolyglutamate synthase